MTERIAFRIHGMDCADEVALLRRELDPLVELPGRLSFDILRGKMLVEPGDPAITHAQVMEAVRRTGMRAEVWRDEKPAPADTRFWGRRKRTILTALSGVLAVTAFVSHAADVGVLAALGSEGTGVADAVVPPLSIALYAASMICGGWYILPRAFAALLRLRPDMNLLMTIAVIGAAAIGEWFEAAVVTFLFAVSLALESWSVGRARRAVEALMAIAPPTARVIGGDGIATEVNASDVAVGTMILIKPGDRIALDGTVRRGTSAVNQAPITGESLPVEKAPPAEVFAGTVNGDGALEVEVTRVAGETTLAQIIRMVEEAQSRRAPSEQWVDRFARIYTPAILAAAIAVAILGPLITGGDNWPWVYRALVLLVIGCPCALVISTPVSIVASLAAAARAGVLVKGGTFIEVPSKLRALALDKTGTLTAGAPKSSGCATVGQSFRRGVAASDGSDRAS